MNPNNTEEYRKLERRAIEEEYRSGNKKDYTLTLIGLGIAITVMTVYNNVNTDYKIRHNIENSNTNKISKDSLEFKVKKDGIDFKVRK